MKTKTFGYYWVNTVGFLAALPAAFFIGISLLKFSLGINWPYDALSPTLERLGLNDSLGWNINLVILFGPLAAFALSIVQLLSLDWNFTAERLEFRLVLQKKWLPILLGIFSCAILGTLFIYLLAENGII